MTMSLGPRATCGEIVQRYLADARKYPIQAEIYFSSALQICQDNKLLQLEAFVHHTKAMQSIEQAEVLISKGLISHVVCTDMASSYFTLGSIGLPPYQYKQDKEPSYYFSKGIESCITGYKLSSPKIPVYVSKAIIMGLKQGLESQLRLHEVLTAAECIAVINNMAIDRDATCEHMEYLLSKSEKPGSGVAVILSCNFSSFNWKMIASKTDFSTKTMKMLLSQGAVLSFENIEDILDLVDDDKIELLDFALKELKEPLSSVRASALLSLALQKRKIKFCSLLLTKGAEADVSEILKILKPLEIIDQQPLCSLIKSNKTSCEKFLHICVKKGNCQALDYCKSLVREMNKDDIDIHSLIQASVQGNKDKQHSINFLEWLLQEQYVDPNGKPEGIHPLDTTFQLSSSENKNKLYYLLLKYGANFQNVSLLSESEKINIIQTVVLSALTEDDSTTTEKCKLHLLQFEEPVDITIFLEYYAKSQVKNFIEWLLLKRKLDHKKLDGCLLDSVTSLSMSIHYKVELLCLLLRHGAQILCCTPSKTSEKPFLHKATVLAIEADNTELIKIACPQLFKEIKHMSESEKLLYIMDSHKNTPLHVVMARKETPTTIELCKVLSEYIDPNLTNIYNLKPGQRRNDTKKNGHLVSRRQQILQEAAMNFQSKKNQKQKMKKKGSKGKNTKKSVSPPPVNKLSQTNQDLPVAVKKTNKENSAVELSSDQISVLLEEQLRILKGKPSSYFTPPPNFKRQISKQQAQQSLSRQVSGDGTLIEHSPSTLPEVICESFIDEPDIDGKRFEDCMWEIECTENVKKYLSHKKTSLKLKEAVINKMKEIATDGIRPNHRISGVLGDNIFETRFSKGGRILWEVAIQFSPRLTAKHCINGKEKDYLYSEVIRIWAVVSDHDNVEREIRKIKASRSRGLTAANPIPLYYKKDDKESNNNRNPRYYKYCEPDITETCDVVRFYPAGSTNNDEYNVATFYTVNSIFERSMIEGSDVRRDFPFKEWPKEHDIINMPEGKQSILLLGRSGTGKTTCCLYRMWNQFHLFWSSEIAIQQRALPILKSEVKIDMQEVLAKYDSESANIDDHEVSDNKEDKDHKDKSRECLHQIFITKNYVLCSQMKKRFYDLAAGSTKTAQHMQFEDSDPPLSLCDVDDHAYPLFLTARQFFIILDNSLKDDKNFFLRDDAGNLKEKLVSSDYDHEDPDTLLDLEESDSEVDYEEGDDADDIDFKVSVVPKTKLKERHEITATYFTTKIWPKLSKSASINAKLDPLLVWMEIKSFIKGSQNAAESNEGYLSQKDYINLGRKMAANYSEQREEIYKIFEDYLRYIQNSKEMLFDDSELIHNLYSRLNCLDDLPWSIHSIYVDEVQDFTQAELSILLRICRNPNDLFLTGDTAQSIMRGISFRFSDLRYLFFCASEQVSKKKKKTHNIVVPKVQDLQINFRSHTGVLNLAASIIDVMKKCFPSSFDRLPGDEGMFTGPMPIVVESSSITDLALVMQTNKRESSKKIEFGAHQVIIVQSEEAKQSLPDVLKSSIVLTVFESKGLEFDDVLLFDFFKDSQVKDEWRVVTAYINDEERKPSSPACKDKNPFGKSRPLVFDDTQHKSLNSELKYLYTAITRARCNLWIYDSDELKRRPVFDYWYRRGLIKVIRVDEVTEQDESTLFASTSSSEEWKTQGNYFKKKKLWEPAMKCFQKAQCKSLELEAHAYSLVQQARRPNTKLKEAQELYLHAAKYFLDSNKIENNYQCIENAARCLMNSKKYTAAADLFVLLGRNDKALKCFRKTKDYSVLAEIKEKMGKPNDAIRILLRHGMIIKALECSSKHDSEVLPCYKKEYIAHKQVRKFTPEERPTKFHALLKYLPPHEQVRYLKEVKLYKEAYQILLDENRFDEVYQLCKAQGWFDEGIQLAHEKKNAHEKIIFLLYKATKEIEDNSISAETINLLKKHCGLLTEKENRCMLIWGMIKRNNTSLNNVRSYYKKNNIAYLEVLNIATAHAEYDSDNHRWNNIHLNRQEDLVMTILDACRNAENISAELENVQKDTNSPLVTNIERFYGLERDLSGMYLIPESSYLWTNELLRNHISIQLMKHNQDGMMKVEFSEVMKAVCSRLNEFCGRWIVEDTLNIVEVLCRRIKRFSYHEQLMNNGGHLKESCLSKLDKSAHLQAYLDILSSLYQAKELGNANISINVVQLALNALSPQATCYLQIPQTNAQLSSLVLSGKLCDTLYDRAKEILSTVDEKFRIDEWFETWRILNIIKNGIHEMKSTLQKRSGEISVMIKSLQIQSDKFPQYVYNKKWAQYNHLMFLWLNVCGKLKIKKVYAACIVCVREFILPIAYNHALWETVSVSNLLNTATIQLVAILTMTNICSIYSRLPGIMYIPQSYLHTVKVYFLTMRSSESLFDSCLEDVMKRRKEALPFLKDQLVHLMRLILRAVIGKLNAAFNLLQRATSLHNCLENHEAEHSLIFVLTLLANMSLVDSVPDTELHSLQQQICDSIKQCDKPIIQQSYQSLLTSSTVNNFFAIIMTLLQSSRDSLQCLDIHFTGPSYKVVCTTKQAKLEGISQRRLITLSQNLTREDKAVRITQFKLRPSAPVFVPSWKKSNSVVRETVSQPVLSNNEDTTLDDIDIAQDINDDAAEDDASEFNDFEITNGICQVCASMIYSDLPEDDSISAKRAKNLNHCRSEEHQKKLKERETFSSELEVYELDKKHLSILAKECNEQYDLFGQYHVLKDVIDRMNEILKEFEKVLERIYSSAEWREGITQMEAIGGKIKSLIMRGERELKISKDMKLKLDQEQEEQDKQEDEEQEELDSDNWEEDIPLADPNSGYAAKKKKRAKKRRAKTK